MKEMYVIYVLNENNGYWESFTHTKSYKEADAIMSDLMEKGKLIQVQFYNM